MEIQTLDVVIVGAGLSGICAAYHIKDKCPNKNFLVFEARASMGGTWDLFKYPGIRSDSDMYTLGFSFNPWEDAKAIADGKSILQYIKDTAKKFDLEKHIRYNSRVIESNWNSEKEIWELKIQEGEGAVKIINSKFVFSCTGYYNYTEAHNPQFEGSEQFKGDIIHPQFWDTDFDYTNKKIVVIGSGATAVTLVPELAKKAEHVTMLQRSPTYIINLPSEDPIANWFKKVLPMQWAHNISRWKNILISLGLYTASRKWPDKMRKFITDRVERYMGNKFNKEDFNPKYNPWDQRLCLIPDNDLFKSLKSGKSSIQTDTIKKFTETGILLNSDKELEADLIVTATGLKIQLLGGIVPYIDGKEIHSGDLIAYKGVMFSGIPNFAVAVGYTNASWTLKCDLNCMFFARVLQHMDRNNLSTVKPKFDHKKFTTEPLLDFDAGYIQRALDVLPKQGSRKPWKVHQNYVKDLMSLKYGSVTDPVLQYN